MPIAFSTCWNSGRHQNGEDLIDEILDLGFDAVELGHGLKAPQVQGILAAHAKKPFAVSSLHNFCPLPPEVMRDQPDFYEYTSHRVGDRQRAVRLTCQTIDMAARFGASRVVLHCGRIRTLDATNRLKALVREEGNFTKAYAEAKLAAVIERERKGDGYVQRSLECLTEIADHAAKAGVNLGLENRDDYEAVPSEREFLNYLQRLDAANAFYWHDFGHCQIKQNLGLLDHEEWLDHIGSRALGCHVHDVKWPFEDHRAPFTGEISFEKLIPKLPVGCLFVFELHPRTSKEDIVSALDRWKSVFGP